MHAQKRWVIAPVGEAMKVEAIAKSQNLSATLANLLVQRGIDTPEKASDFFNPKLSNLHDPYLMQDMMAAVQRIDEAVRMRQRVMIYGDYDVDGTTAVALVYLFFKQFIPDIMFYIPDRYAEGYGISEKSIDYANENNVKLIITLDCGIKAINKVKYAKDKYGIDFIVSDHHLPAETLPEAVAVLDPKREDCNYPFKDLSGCGVGFKLVQAFCQFREIDFNSIVPLLDLVAVSIASDIVPIVGENRILAYYGLRQLNTNPNKGLKAIIQMSGLEKHPIQIDDIIFKIGPRINAAGRMEIEIDPDSVKAQSGGRTAVKLLTASDDIRAITLVNTIDRYNEERKKFDRENTKDAHNIIDQRAVENKQCTVIYNPEWQKGVVGIVASRLIETYYRPTVVLTLSNGFITGSARSIPGFDLYQAIDHCSDLLENFGGHTYAAGMTMKPENLEKFKAKFEAYVDKTIDPKILIPQINIDEEIELSEITPELRRDLQRFQPFGPGNSSPTFATYRVSDSGHAKKVGENQKHLKMELGSRSKSSKPISAIAFGQIEHFEYIQKGGYIDVCFSLVENHHQGDVKPQLRIYNIRPSE